MNSYSKKLRVLVDEFEKNEISETQTVNRLYYIYEDWNRKLAFEPQIRKLIKNNDDFFNSQFGETKHDLIKFFNDNAVFHTEEYPLKISFRKEDINEQRIDQFLDKIGFIVNGKIETDEEVFYISRLK